MEGWVGQRTELRGQEQGDRCGGPCNKLVHIHLLPVPKALNQTHVWACFGPRAGDLRSLVVLTMTLCDLNLVCLQDFGACISRAGGAEKVCRGVQRRKQGRRLWTLGKGTTELPTVTKVPSCGTGSALHVSCASAGN